MPGLLMLGALGASLSVDAFAAALGKGATTRGARLPQAVQVGLVFGLFEAITPAIGYLLGRALNGVIADYDHWVAFTLLAAVGLWMIHEALAGADAAPEAAPPATTSFWRLAATAVATSIDAAAVGVSLALMDVSLWMACLVIGGITTIVATAGMLLGRRIGPFLGRYAGIAGGIVLMAIGGAILIQHLSA